MNIRVSNILSVKQNLSGRNTKPALLESLSTGADDAGIGTGILQVFVLIRAGTKVRTFGTFTNDYNLRMQ